jgi:hypothetical protein
MTLKRITLITTIALAGLHCKKDYKTDWKTVGRYGYVDSTNNIILIVDNITNVNDTARISIQSIVFDLKYVLDLGDSLVEMTRTIAEFDRAFSSNRRYIVRYIGTEPLIAADSLPLVRDYIVTYPMNKNLYGKEIFQVYDTLGEKMYLNLWASSKNVSVTVWMIGTNRYLEAATCYNHYLHFLYKNNPSLFGN